MSILQQPIHGRIGHQGIGKHTVPLGNGSIGGQDGRSALVALAHNIAQVVGFFAAKRTKTEIVDDQGIDFEVARQSPIAGPVTSGRAQVCE
jgi:hypothetical protein